MKYKMGLPQGRDNDFQIEEAKTKVKTEEAMPSGNTLWRIPKWFPDIDAATENTLHRYHQELMRFNGRINLISRNSEREADETHFADSIEAARLLAKEELAGTLYDVGSGNGFPGIICAVLMPDLRVKLVEADSRKVEFLRHVISELEIMNCSAICSRLESIATDGKSAAVFRGFANISKTALACNKVFKRGERLYHMKSGSWSTEVASMPSQIVANWAPSLLGEYVLPATQARRAVVCTLRR